MICALRILNRINASTYSASTSLYIYSIKMAKMCYNISKQGTHPAGFGRMVLEMISYKNILVPYDGSAHAKKALGQAIELAVAAGAKLHVVSVCNIVAVMSNFDQVSIAEGYLNAELSQDLEDQCRQDLADAESVIPEGVEKDLRYEVGSPGPVLLQIAEDIKCDLIVMGSRGLGPLKGIFMGSVSSYIVSRSECPVLIVK